MQKIFLLLLISFFVALQATGQDQNNAIKLNGRVLSTDQKPIAGATLSSKLHGTEASSDDDGNFSIQLLPGTDTLIISHIGFLQKRLPLNQTTNSSLIIVMERSSLELEEVMVSTGIEKIPKERATGSFALINNKLFNEQVGTGVLNRLQSITNGYTSFPLRNTGDNLSVVRGLSTLSVNIAKPLIILDNFEYQGDINNINPNDVENITFLKDAAAGSIWGAKAANGVIVITTKKGLLNQPVKVELNTNLTIADKPDLFYSKNISSGDFIDLEKYLFSEGYYNSMLPYPEYYPLSPVVNLLDKANRGIISDSEADAGINAFRSQDVRKEYEKYFYKNSVNQQYAISLSGGTKNLAWILSGGFDKNSSELNARYNRVNMRFDNTYVPFKNLEINSSVYYTQSKTTAGRPAVGSISAMGGAIAPYTLFADENGNPLPVYTTYNPSYLDTAGGGRLLDWRYFPLDDYKHISNQTNIENLNAVLGIRYKVFTGFSIDIKYRYQSQHTETEYLQGQGSFATRNLINSFSQLTPGSVIYKIPKGDILDLSNSYTNSQNLRSQLNFSKQWHTHEIVALAGSEISESVNKNNYYRTYGHNRDILTYVDVDYTNTYPILPYRSNGFIPNSSGFGKRNNRFVSFYANGAYTYKTRYTLSASARRDASNAFGVKTNDKWKPLWSTGVSWEISNEPFYKLQLLYYLRLKMTYGYQGNIDPAKVALTTIRYSNINPLTLTPYSVVDNFYNPELKWEQVSMLNTAVEWASKNRRLSGSFEYYEKKMADLYAATRIESTMGIGFATMVRNAGKMKGRGFDIELNSINIDRKFRWATHFIFNTYKDKVLKLKNPSTLLGSDIAGSTGFTGLEGYSPFVYFAYQWAGLDPATGDPQGYLDRQVSKDYGAITYEGTKFSDLKYIGSQFPRIFGSLGNSFSWRNFSLNIRVIYKFNYYFRRESINYRSLVNQSIGHSDYSLRWQKPGDELSTTVPSFIYPVNNSRNSFYLNSEILATKADHIRLQYINISYDLNKQVFKKLPFSQATLYVVSNNLGIIWKANEFGIDPDYNNNNIPPAKSIAVGLRISL